MGEPIAQPTAPGKPAIQSTQNWMNIILGGALSLITIKIPWMTQHPEAALAIQGIVNILWRTFITKEPVNGFLKTE